MSKIVVEVGDVYQFLDNGERTPMDLKGMFWYGDCFIVIYHFKRRPSAYQVARISRLRIDNPVFYMDEKRMQALIELSVRLW